MLEQLSRQQPPINPSVDAYKQENDKVEHYLNELKKNPDDPYLRAQLHQAMDDRQHLYNLIQGNKNPFKTETNTSKGTQTQTQISTGIQTTIPQAQSASTGAQTTIPQTRSVGTQSDLLSEMEIIREMFKTPPVWRTRHQSFSGSSTEKPEGRTRHDSGPGAYQYVEKPHKNRLNFPGDLHKIQVIKVRHLVDHDHKVSLMERKTGVGPLRPLGGQQLKSTNHQDSW